MTTTQTPADINLLDLPEELRNRKIQYAMCVTGCIGVQKASLNLDDAIQSYALACVEADRRERSEQQFFGITE